MAALSGIRPISFIVTANLEFLADTFKCLMHNAD